MPKFAVLDNNVVTNIIVAKSLESAEEITSCNCVLLKGSDFVDIGYAYSEDTKTFSKV